MDGPAIRYIRKKRWKNMKSKRMLTALALGMCLLLGSCVPEETQGGQTGADGSTGSPGSQTAVYEAMIAQLQQELRELQEAQLQQSAEYQDRIDRLEELLAAQGNGQGGNESSGSTSTPDVSELFSYTETAGGLEITSYHGQDTLITVPAEIDGRPVVSIGESAFRNSPAEQVIVPDSVRSIGWFAFCGSYRLSSVILPASVEQIGYGAFDLCSRQLRITCPPGSYAAEYAASYGIEVIARE